MGENGARSEDEVGEEEGPWPGVGKGEEAWVVRDEVHGLCTPGNPALLLVGPHGHILHNQTFGVHLAQTLLRQLKLRYGEKGRAMVTQWTGGTAGLGAGIWLMGA